MKPYPAALPPGAGLAAPLRLPLLPVKQGDIELRKPAEAGHKLQWQ
jgi:hypothetical protein